MLANQPASISSLIILTTWTIKGSLCGVEIWVLSIIVYWSCFFSLFLIPFVSPLKVIATKRSEDEILNDFGIVTLFKERFRCTLDIAFTIYSLDWHWLSYMTSFSFNTLALVFFHLWCHAQSSLGKKAQTAPCFFVAP